MSPDEIDFNQLSPTKFEELCFDLLMELGFRKLIWRQGGADSGRDIEGTREVVSGILEPFEETWFFECKRYTNAVPPEDLNSKIAWADAEKPKHLVFFVSSYVSNNARDWLEKIGKDKFYRIHLIEGKQLQQLVSRSRALIARHFPTDAQQLMKQAYRAWILHNLVPEPWLLRTLADLDNLTEYEPGELAFLWASLKMRFDELNANMASSWGESFDILFTMLRRHANCESPVLESASAWALHDEKEGLSEHDMVYTKVYAADLSYLVDFGGEHFALYSFVRDSEEGLEVLVKQDSSLTFYIRYVAAGPKAALDAAKRILHS